MQSESEWAELTEWWIEELAADPAYEEEIAPLLIDLLRPQASEVYLDLGCGDGRMARKVLSAGARVVGCDLNFALLSRAVETCPVVRLRLPDLGPLRSSSVDGAFIGLVLEHLEDDDLMFAEAARVVRLKGVLAIVINHPIWTAPSSSPMEDQTGEVLWRTGTYFGRGFSEEPAGGGTVRFYHRTMADLLNAASRAGWYLERAVELGISERQVERFPEYAGQEQIPRLLGLRFRAWPL